MHGTCRIDKKWYLCPSLSHSANILTLTFCHVLLEVNCRYNFTVPKAVCLRKEIKSWWYLPQRSRHFLGFGIAFLGLSYSLRPSMTSFDPFLYPCGTQTSLVEKWIFILSRILSFLPSWKDNVSLIQVSYSIFILNSWRIVCSFYT